MYCEVISASIAGIGAKLVTVEVDVTDGLPSFSMVGMLACEVREARDRVRTAIRNMGVSIPPKRITINLSPADVRKEGTGFDLPIAIAVLCAVGMISGELLRSTLFIGELSLDGKINKVNGVLPIIMAGKYNGIRRAFVPSGNAREAAIVNDIEVYGVETLTMLIAGLNNENLLEQEIVDFETLLEKRYSFQAMDFGDINGQQLAKRATEIAVAGMHNILYIGPPGAGKSMLAKRIPGILPDLTFEECLELTGIYSISGLLSNQNLIISRPFRSIHHNITAAAITGGGRIPKPGEATLSHRGVLFLDEIPEFKRSVLENLRQPLEDRKIVISRTGGSEEFPTDFMLVAAMNPCPCGYYPDRNKCNCTQYSINKYLSKISGPIMDRIDICIGMTPITPEDMRMTVKQAQSKNMAMRINKAHDIQIKRYENEGIQYNSSLENNLIHKYCSLGKIETDYMDMVYSKFPLSARGYYKILKIARTIADLDNQDQILTKHLSEAVTLRNIEVQ